MKNLSIRLRILATVVVVNLLGAMAVMIYLHQSYISDVDTNAAANLGMGKAAFEEIAGQEDELDLLDPAQVSDVLARMKAITQADYGLLVDKTEVDESEYLVMVAAVNQPNRWNERSANVLISATDETLAEKTRLEIDAASVPDIGRLVGVENGACSETCHSRVGESDAYWAVAWSNDSRSRAHAVFPVIQDGRPVALLYSIEDISWQANHAKDTMMRTLLVISLTLILATLVIGGLIDTLVFKRLTRMTASMEDITMRVAGGDFDARYVPDGSNDEIGQFEQFYSSMIDLMNSTLQSLMKK